jgi:hypothetical protein
MLALFGATVFKPGSIMFYQPPAGFLGSVFAGSKMEQLASWLQEVN